MNQLFEWLAKLVQGARPWIIVLAWERAVRVRLGKKTSILDPGFHFRIPYIDEIRTVNSRFRVACFPCLTVSTKDAKTVTCAGNVEFRIMDPMKAFLSMSTPESLIGAMAQGSAAAFIARRHLLDVEIEALEAHVAHELTDWFGDRGVEVERVRLVDFAVVRVLRLLEEQWRPRTNEDASHS